MSPPRPVFEIFSSLLATYIAENAHMYETSKIQLDSQGRPVPFKRVSRDR